MEKMIGVYLRVSTFEQAKTGYGLGDQEEQINRYLDLYYPNVTNVKQYKDDGYSAKSLDRPAMKQLIYDIEHNHMEAVITYKLDRLSRSVVDTYNFIQLVSDHDCALIAVVDRLDISSANGRMLVGILSIIAQWEREVIRERTIAAAMEMARMGKFPYPTAPYGWKLNDDHVLEINDKQAEAVNFIADCYLEGELLQDIEVRLRDEIGMKYSYRNMKRLLLRETNIGIYVLDGVSFDNVVPSIMDTDKFKRIKEVSQFRQRHALTKKAYLFYGLIWCSHCRKRVHQSCTVKHLDPVSDPDSIKIYRYYQCSNCKRRISQVKIGNQVFFDLFQKDADKTLQRSKTVTKRKIKDLEKKHDTLTESYLNHEIDAQTFNKSSKKIVNNLNRIKKELNMLDDVSYQKFLTMDDEDKYDYIHKIVKKIYVDMIDGSVIKIEYKSFK